MNAFTQLMAALDIIDKSFYYKKSGRRMDLLPLFSKYKKV